MQSITNRPFQSEDDFWKIRNLLIETYLSTPPGLNWEVRRWDGQRYHNDVLDQFDDWQKTVRLWETAGGDLVGAVHLEGRKGAAFLELHPNYRHRIETEMIAWAEENLTELVPESDQRQLHIDVLEYDIPRRLLLEQRGYEKQPWGGVLRRLRFGQKPLDKAEIAAGYTLRCTRADDLADAQRVADLLNAAFNRDFHTGQEVQNFWQNAPCYRNELDLVAEAPDGTFGAYVGIALEDTDHYAIVEPVCTHPDHRRKGLARTLILEGLARAQATGAVDAYVGTGDDPGANRLYDGVGFTEAYKEYAWRKIW